MEALACTEHKKVELLLQRRWTEIGFCCCAKVTDGVGEKENKQE